MRNAILFKENENSWARWIKKRIDNNLNFLGFFTGATGSGKTYNCISLAYKNDPEFSIDQICFDILELMTKINECNDKKTIMGKKKYKQLILEESQKSLSNKEWQSRINKVFNYVASTFRNQNIILYFNAPFMDSVDSSVMKLIHATFECRGWNKKTKLSKVRPKILQWNSRKKKFYEHSLYVLKDGKYHKMIFMNLLIPPKHLRVAYEKKKTAFTNKLNKQVYAELMRLDNKEKNPRKPLTEKQNEVMGAIAKYGVQKAMEHLGLAQATLYEHKRLAEAKGYSLNEFKFIPIEPNMPKKPENP